MPRQLSGALSLFFRLAWLLQVFLPLSAQSLLRLSRSSLPSSPPLSCPHRPLLPPRLISSPLLFSLLPSLFPPGPYPSCVDPFPQAWRKEQSEGDQDL